MPCLACVRVQKDVCPEADAQGAGPFLCQFPRPPSSVVADWSRKVSRALLLGSGNVNAASRECVASRTSPAGKEEAMVEFCGDAEGKSHLVESRMEKFPPDNLL